MNDARISQKQRDALALLASGRTLTKDDSDLATSVYALRDRGLVETPSVRNYVGAKLTSEGFALLAAREESAPQPAGEHQIDIDDLAEQLNANGEIIVENPPADLRRTWRRAVFALRRSQLLGSETGVIYTGRDTGDLRIRLVHQTSRDDAVRVPRRMRHPHPIIKATRAVLKDAASDEGWVDTFAFPGVAHIRVGTRSDGRALRILHAIVKEAMQRGYNVERVGGEDCRGGLTIRIRGRTFEVCVVETRQQPRRERKGLPSVPVPSGHLYLRLGHHGAKLVSDTTKTRIEMQLAKLFAELERASEQRLAVDTLRPQSKEAAAAERRRTRIARHVDDVLRDWRRSAEVRAFVAEARARGLPDSPEASWTELLAYADHIDPLHRGRPS